MTATTATTPPARPIFIPMTTKRDDDSLTTDHVLLVGGRHCGGIGSIRRGGEGRQVQDGPMVPGPWAYAYGLCLCTANPKTGTGAEMERLRAANKVHRVENGTLLDIDGVIYEVSIERHQYIHLTAVEA